MKKCYTCKQDKDISMFFKKAAAKDGLQPNCKECANKYYTRPGVIGKYVERNKKSRATNKILLENYKSNLKSRDCGEDHPACLDFHHHNDDKSKSVADMTSSTYKWDTILQEIEKCVVLCANCHRKIHYEERKMPR